MLYAVFHGSSKSQRESVLAEGKELHCVWRGDAWIVIKEDKVSLQSPALVAAEPHWLSFISQKHHYKLPPPKNAQHSLLQRSSPLPV